MPFPRTRCLRLLTLAASVAGAAVPLSAHAASTLQSPSAYQPTYLSPLAPGVDMAGYLSPATGGTAASDVLTVDLSHPGVSTGLLAGRVTDTGTIGSRAIASKAIAAVNGDYYAIGASNAPILPEIKGGTLLKATSTPTLIQGVGTDGVARRAAVTLAGTARWGKGGNVSLTRYNSDLDGAAMPATSLSLFDASWGAARVGFVRAPAKVSYALVGSNGKVLKASRSFTPQTVPPGGLLLVGTGQWTSIGALPKGTPVSHHIGFTTESPVAFSWAVGGGLELVRDGKAVHNAPPSNTDPHAARTAMGWSQDGHKLFLVTVEYGDGSVGHGANEIADELKAFGAWEAILLDGGGSTTLMARLRGTDERDQIGAVQDGFQRPVANGIGVFVPQGSGVAKGIDVSSDSTVVFPGLQRRIRVSPYDEWYGKATVDAATALLSSATGAFAPTGNLKVRAIGTGSDTVTASVAGFTGTVGLRVLDPLTTLRLPDEIRIDPGTATTMRVQGASRRGERAPIDAADLTVAPQASQVTTSVGAQGELVITARPHTDGAAVPVIVTVGSVTQTMIVRSGYRDTQLPDLGGRGVWAARGAKSKIAGSGAKYGGVGLHLALQKQGTATLKPKAGPIALPGDAVRMALWAKADGKRHFVRALVADAAGHTRWIALGTTGPAKGWTHWDVALPAGTVQLQAIQVVGPGGPHPGEIQLDGLITRS